ncbi:MAG: hypothetical protein ACI9JO_000853 [Psychrobacter okhotskensis]
MALKTLSLIYCTIIKNLLGKTGFYIAENSSISYALTLVAVGVFYYDKYLLHGYESIANLPSSGACALLIK